MRMQQYLVLRDPSCHGSSSVRDAFLSAWPCLLAVLRFALLHHEHVNQDSRGALSQEHALECSGSFKFWFNSKKPLSAPFLYLTELTPSAAGGGARALTL
jgi:hypothetical protein